MSEKKSKPTAREIERYYFEQFRTLYILPSGEITYCDKPDVIVSGDHTLGVEITSLYIKDGSDCTSEQVQSVRRLEALCKAQVRHREKSGRQIELSVEFDPLHPIFDTESTVSKLVELAFEIEHEPTTLQGCLTGNAEGLRFVYHTGQEYPDAKWRCSQSFTVSVLDPDRLISIVEEKSKKVVDYKRCDEYWLLIVVDFMNSAQDQELILPTEFYLPKSSFSRILIYKPQFAQVLDVQSVS
jgi:hypothetical protein